MTLWLGKLEVELLQLGRGHTKGDTVVWLPQDRRCCFSGDLVEYERHAVRRRRLLQRLADDARRDRGAQAREARARAAAPRSTTPADVHAGLERHARVHRRRCSPAVKRGVGAGKDLRTVYKDTYAALKPKFGHWVIFDHCLPFDVSRAYDEATDHRDPRIWTAERDKEMWQALEG